MEGPSLVLFALAVRVSAGEMDAVVLGVVEKSVGVVKGMDVIVSVSGKENKEFAVSDTDEENDEMALSDRDKENDEVVVSDSNDDEGTLAVASTEKGYETNEAVKLVLQQSSAL